VSICLLLQSEKARSRTESDHPFTQRFGLKTINGLRIASCDSEGADENNEVRLRQESVGPNGVADFGIGRSGHHSICTDAMISPPSTAKAVNQECDRRLLLPALSEIPRVSEMVRARSTCVMGILNKRYGIPRARASFSFRPMRASSGSVKERIRDKLPVVTWLPTGEVVTNHAEVVNAHVGELRASRYFADCPNPGAVVCRRSLTLR